MKTIKLTFQKNGKVKKEVSGFTGTGCLVETDFIDASIGKVDELELKPEYSLPVLEPTQEAQRLGN